MGQSTNIEWADHTCSPWHGCEHATLPDGSSEHPGCAHCYAELRAKRNPGTLGVWGPDGIRVRSKSFAENCRKWNSAAAQAGKMATVFPSICDPFEDHPGLEWWRRDMFDVIDDCPWLRFLLLTKRPQNILKMWFGVEESRGTIDPTKWYHHYKVRPNVWLLTSVSDQATADAMIPHLLECRGLCPVLGISAEPLLGPINLTNIGEREPGGYGIDWVIVGGESGRHARPMPPRWVRSLRDQCQAASVPFFFKQWGEWVPAPHIDPHTHASAVTEIEGHRLFRVGKKAAGRLLDGRTWDEMPAGQ